MQNVQHSTNGPYPGLLDFCHNWCVNGKESIAAFIEALVIYSIIH